MAIHQLNGVIRRLRGGVPCGPDCGDGQLLERYLARGDGAAFEALVARHGPMVLCVCRRVLRNPHDAEDAFQATLARYRRLICFRSRRRWMNGRVVDRSANCRA